MNTESFVNVGLIKHPMNWVTVILMVFIAGIAVHLLMRFWQNSD